MRRESTRVLVTGGAGFLGAHLVRALVGAGHSVRVLDDLSAGRRGRLDGLSVDLRFGDVRDGPAVRRAVDGAEVVFHLAGVQAPCGTAAVDVARADEVNVGGAVNLLEAALHSRPEAVVLAGSGEVYGRASACVLHEGVPPLPLTPEAVQRLAVEHYAQIYHLAGLPTVVLRLSAVYGPGQGWDRASTGLVARMCRLALRGDGPSLAADPRHSRDFLHVDDAVAALLAAATAAAGQVVNIASGEVVTVGRLWHLVAGLVPTPLATPTWTVPPPGEPEHLRLSIARAARELGFRPRIRLRDGLRPTVEHFLRAPPQERPAWFSPPDPAAPEPPPEAWKSVWPKPTRAVPPPPRPAPPEAGPTPRPRTFPPAPPPPRRPPAPPRFDRPPILPPLGLVPDGEIELELDDLVPVPS